MVWIFHARLTLLQNPRCIWDQHSYLCLLDNLTSRTEPSRKFHIELDIQLLQVVPSCSFQRHHLLLRKRGRYTQTRLSWILNGHNILRNADSMQIVSIWTQSSPAMLHSQTYFFLHCQRTRLASWYWDSWFLRLSLKYRHHIHSWREFQCMAKY